MTKTPVKNPSGTTQAAPTADDIVDEIIAEEVAALATVGKTFQSSALNEWKPALLKAVKIKLASRKSDWATDRAKVLPVARDMALIAALLSGSAATVSKARTHAAFRACKDHQGCPAPAGSGAWCNFNI